MISERTRGRHDLELRGRWWQSAAVQRELGLTPAQTRTLDSVFEQGLDERLARHRTIEEMDRLLERMMERANADDDGVERLSERVEALRAQENVRYTRMLFAMYRTLTRQQRAAFTEMKRGATGSASLPDRESPPNRD